MKKIEKMKVLEFMLVQIEELKSVNRLGTAENYRTVHNSFERYLKQTKRKDLPFAALTSEILVSYETWLHNNGISRNSSSCYLRCLRACYNKYLKMVMYVSPLDKIYQVTRRKNFTSHPLSDLCSRSLFNNVYTGVAPTPKRAITPEEIAFLAKFDIRTALIQSGKNPDRKGFNKIVERLSRSRDFFIFCFFSRGLTFVDLAYLRLADIHGDTIRYYRKKTGQQIIIKIEPEMHTIMEKHRTPHPETSPYLFPILSSVNPAEAHQQYRHAISRYNIDLHTLTQLLKISHPQDAWDSTLTSYVSRHTWATCAHQCNVPISIISQAMGHTSIHTTEIYLKSFEQSVIDDANHQLIEKIFSCNSREEL